MKTIGATFGIIAVLVASYSFSGGNEAKKGSEYRVARLKQSMKIDGNWDKPQWKKVKAIDISNYMGDLPAFKPVAQAKMMYNNENLYVIFHVQDRYVRCITKDFFGPVWEDAAVEFFFAPDSSLPEQYFNLEINCGGTPLMHYNIIPRKEPRRVDLDDLKQVEIAHTLPQIIDPEMTEPVTWTLEYRIPLAILDKYSHVSHPGKGVKWRANFYKIAGNNSNHHYITWSFVDNPVPDFHLPKFFGTLIFE
jgi:hypothetical protein